MNRVKKYGSELSKIRNPKPVQVMELDEIHSYIGPKNCKWIWIAVDREAREFVDFVIGNRQMLSDLRSYHVRLIKFQ